MGRKSRHTAEEKLCAIKEYLSGNGSMVSIAKQLGVHEVSFKQWIANYESMGTAAFLTNQNKHYSKLVKEQAVTAYLAGEGSYRDICKKYKIYSTTQLKSWVKKYNGHEVYIKDIEEFIIQLKSVCCERSDVSIMNLYLENPSTIRKIFILKISPYLFTKTISSFQSTCA